MDRRAFLHVALAFILMSLTCDFGTVCAMADDGGDCCCATEGMPTPCTDLSGGDEGPATPDPSGTLLTGDRFSVAILAVAPATSAPAASEPATAGRLGPGRAARETPLYLSHCAFLC